MELNDTGADPAFTATFQPSLDQGVVYRMVITGVSSGTSTVRIALSNGKIGYFEADTVNQCHSFDWLMVCFTFKYTTTGGWA